MWFFILERGIFMERTKEMEDVREEMYNIRLQMQVIKDEKSYFQARKKLKELRRRMARLKYSEMIESEDKGKGINHG